MVLPTLSATSSPPALSIATVLTAALAFNFLPLIQELSQSLKVNTLKSR